MNMMAIKDRFERMLARYPRLRPWIWFGILWLGGLLAITGITYPIKLMIRMAS